MFHGPEKFCTQARASVRSGISMIELLVSLAVIGLLISLLVPAVSRSRTAAQRVRCVNNLRNLAFGLTQYDHLHGRLPASGTYFDPTDSPSAPRYSWAVSILPWLDQANLYEQWNLEESYLSDQNRTLSLTSIEVFRCPLDITLSPGNRGDQSYVVNGGVGLTYRTRAGIGDCPVDWQGQTLDLNGDGFTCRGQPVDYEDRTLLKRMGLFFAENTNPGGTVRHHSIAEIIDGSSQTFLVSENIRTGYNPADDAQSFANPHPKQSAFYIGSPCLYGDCSEGNVDYNRSNAGGSRINSGRDRPEGSSSVPNSYHPGGVNMAYADGHVSFLSESISGSVYAALASPQGLLLNGTPLQQSVVTGDSF